MQTIPEKEKQEIDEIYRAKGFEGEDLNRVVAKITSNKDVWLKTMLTEELGLNLEILGNSLRGALVMFGSFLLGGILPILPYFAVKAEFTTSIAAIIIAIAISVTSFIVGAIKGRMAKKSWIKSGSKWRGSARALPWSGIALDQNSQTQGS